MHGGSGAIGGIAIQLARHRGATVAATCAAANVDYVRSLGADPVVAYDREDFDQVLEGYDVVLDPIGGEVHRRSYDVLKPGGILVYLIAAPIEDRSAQYGVTTVRALIEDNRQVLEAVVRLAAEGAVKPQVCRILPLSEAAEAQRMLEAREHSRGRVILQVGG